MTPGANVIKHFTVVSYDFSFKARAFVPGKPFQPSLMFVDKAGAYLPAFQVLHSRVGSRASPANIRLGLDKHSCLLRRFVKHSHKKFNNIGSWKLLPGRRSLQYSPFAVVVTS